MITYC